MTESNAQSSQFAYLEQNKSVRTEVEEEPTTQAPVFTTSLKSIELKAAWAVMWHELTCYQMAPGYQVSVDINDDVTTAPVDLYSLLGPGKGDPAGLDGIQLGCVNGADKGSGMRFLLQSRLLHDLGGPLCDATYFYYFARCGSVV